MSALFSKHIGVTVREYLRIRKVGLAKQLLDGGASVTFACYESGFGDCSYFIKCFKQYTGLTPLQYKQGHSVGV
jgi:methylphosphotriester-DNA--protein-cysteine methyltransferase